MSNYDCLVGGMKGDKTFILEKIIVLIQVPYWSPFSQVRYLN